MSACVKWAKEHVDAFNGILARQLSSVGRGDSTWLKCMEQAHEHVGMLNEVGLDFKELIGVDGVVEEEERVVGLGVSS